MSFLSGVFKSDNSFKVSYTSKLFIHCFVFCDLRFSRACHHQKLHDLTMAMLLLLLPLLFLLLLGTGGRLLRRGPFSLDGKVVVVTGAGRGLGRQLARRVLQVATGATLVLLDVDAAALKDARAALEAESQASKRSNQLLTFECDVADDRCGCCRTRDGGASRTSADVRDAASGLCASALAPS